MNPRKFIAMAGATAIAAVCIFGALGCEMAAEGMLAGMEGATQGMQIEAKRRQKANAQSAELRAKLMKAEAAAGELQIAQAAWDGAVRAKANNTRLASSAKRMADAATKLAGLLMDAAATMSVQDQYALEVKELIKMSQTYRKHAAGYERTAAYYEALEDQ